MSYAAQQFAQQGYVAVSVAYFGMPGLPQTLEKIPVETVGKALDDISKRQDVDANRIGLLGLSKGGEFALLAGATYPQIRAVVADVPSTFAWEGIAQGPGPSNSTWTLAGNTWICGSATTRRCSRTRIRFRRRCFAWRIFNLHDHHHPYK